MRKIREEEVASLYASGQFDADFYVQTYPDVLKTGMDPAEHFLWIGARLGRLRQAPAKSHHGKPEPDVLDVLFVDGTNGTSSTPYRIDRVAEGLRNRGAKVRCVNGADLNGLSPDDVRARHVTFFRAPLWEPYRTFAGKMRAMGAKIVFDIDDLVFEEELIPEIDGYRYLTEEQKDGYVRGVRAYRDFVLYADFCTAATEFLAGRIRSLGKQAFRVRNTLDPDEVRKFAKNPRRRRGDGFVVGYYSGSKTHQADFRNAAEALVQVMTENPSVRFRLVGQFDLDEYPALRSWTAGERPRVEQVDLMPHSKMLEDQLECDLILAPLEVGNPFCEAKSELKFFEAALACRAVVASPTQTFHHATRQGQFAQLADGPDAWLAAFRSAVGNQHELAENVARAHEYVVEEYSTAAAGADAAEAYSLTGERVSPGAFIHQAFPAPTGPRSKDVAVIIPDFPRVSGGHRKIFALCRALEDAGHALTLYVYSERSADEILHDIKAYYTDINPKVVIYRSYLGVHDVAVCTQWLTAYDMKRHGFEGRVIYFVQDFEPMFFPVGTGYIMALSTYKMGYEIVCYGRWVAAKLQTEVGVSSKVIPFVLDHLTYRVPETEGERDIDVLFFARPSQDRRCYQIIIEGLRQLKAEHPRLRIGLFGEASYPDVGFDHINFGAITDLHELARLYHRAKLGICFSTTNPSQLGYEMIACGAVLIDVEIQFAELNFGGDDFVRYCIGTPESMAAGCAELLGNSEELCRRREKGYAFAARMPDDAELGLSFLELCELGSSANQRLRLKSAA